MKKLLSFILWICLQISLTFADYNYKPWFTSTDKLFEYEKSILIDTKEWTADAFYYGQKIWSFPVSVGNYYNPTPKWKFKIVNKHPLMKSQKTWLLMPYWMEFYWNWVYGLHSLPLYQNWAPKYTNADVYKKMNWWCVRFRLKDIRTLYKWTNNETTVIII